MSGLCAIHSEWVRRVYTISLSLWKIKAPFDANKYAASLLPSTTTKPFSSPQCPFSPAAQVFVCLVCMWLSNPHNNAAAKRVWLGIFLVWFSVFFFFVQCPVPLCVCCCLLVFEWLAHVIAMLKRTPVVCTHTAVLISPTLVNSSLSTPSASRRFSRNPDRSFSTFGYSSGYSFVINKKLDLPCGKMSCANGSFETDDGFLSRGRRARPRWSSGDVTSFASHVMYI